ncbi:MAG: FAD-dependent oxidoreductase, partial [Acidobacteriota bacterium]
MSAASLSRPTRRDLPGTHESYWIATTGTGDFPPLPGNIKVDVAIVGGGIAGLTSAYLLSLAGVKVAVVEMHRIVTGVTGYTTAKVSSAHGLIYDELTQKLGHEKAQMYANANEAAIGTIASIISSEDIDCDFRRANAVIYT